MSGGGGHGGEAPEAETIDPGPKTSENLGGSPVFAHLTGDGCPNGAVGYSLVTQGRAYWEANKQNYVISTGGDVVFHADTTHPAVLQSDHGVTEVNAGDTTTIRAHHNINVSATTWHAETPNYFTPFTIHEHHAEEGITQEKVHAWCDKGTYGIELVALGVRSLKEPMPDEPGPHRGKMDWIPFLVAGANLANTFWHPHGGVHFNSDGEFSAGAGAVVGLYGGAAAEVIASLGALLLGGKAAIKGFAFGAVFGGFEACLNALKTVKIAAKKKVEVQSSRATSIIGQTDVRMHGGHLAQMDGEKATVSGAKVFVGAGSDFGLWGDRQGMAIGKMGNAKKFGSPSPDDKLRAGIAGKKIRFTADSGVELRMEPMKSLMEADGKQVKLDVLGFEGVAPLVELET